MCRTNRAARSGNGSLLPWRPFKYLHQWDMRLACHGFVLSLKTNAFRCSALFYKSEHVHNMVGHPPFQWEMISGMNMTEIVPQLHK